MSLKTALIYNIDTDLVSSSCAGTTDGDERIIPLLRVVVCAEIAVLHVVQHAGVRAVRGALTLQLEHDHATARRQKDGARLGRKKSLYASVYFGPGSGSEFEAYPLASSRLRSSFSIYY